MKKVKHRAPTIFTIDSEGRCLAHVALAETNERATLYAEDLERVLAEGWSPFWSYTSTDKSAPHRRYVLVNAIGARGQPRSLTIARLVAKASKGQHVKYADGDRLNLCRENLLVKKGGAWMALESLQPSKEGPREAVVTPAPQQAARVPHVSPQISMRVSEWLKSLRHPPYTPSVHRQTRAASPSAAAPRMKERTR
jgi:hypothetical protein